MVADDVLWRRVDSVNEVKQLPSVGVPGETVNGHHLTTDFDNLSLAVDEHGNFSKALLETTTKCSLGLITNKTK